MQTKLNENVETSNVEAACAEGTESVDPTVLPTVSVILPVRNEGPFIDQSVGAVLSQDYPADRMEVLVVDGMSTDETRDRVREMQRDDPRIELLDNPKQIAPTAMNVGLRAAKNEILIRVDGHCVIAPDYVRRCVEHLGAGADGVGGSIDTIGDNYIARAIAIGMSSKFGVGGSGFRTLRGQTRVVDTVPFPAYHRTTVEQAGFYDEELVRNQDDEYNYRLRKLGKTILLAGDVGSKYYSRGSLKKLWRQYFQYGYWKVRVLQKHPRQMRARQFVPPLFVALLLFTLAAALFWPAAIWLTVGLLSAYLVANLAASIATAAQDWRYLPVMPLVFAILHFSYGSGFLIGLVAFCHRWGGPSRGVSNESPRD